MPIDNIIQKIQSDFQNEVEDIKKETDKEVSEILEIAAKEAQEIQNKINDKISKEYEKYLENIKNEENAKAQNEILKKKWEFLENFYKNALEKISDMPIKNYEKFMSSMISDLPDIEGKILCAEKDKNLIAKLIKSKNDKYEISPDSVKNTGGFILRAKDIEIDNTIETLMEKLKDDTIVEVSKILFEL